MESLLARLAAAPAGIVEESPSFAAEGVDREVGLPALVVRDRRTPLTAQSGPYTLVKAQRVSGWTAQYLVIKCCCA